MPQSTVQRFEPRYSPQYRPRRSSSVAGALWSLLRGWRLLALLAVVALGVLVITSTRRDEPTPDDELVEAVGGALLRAGYDSVEVTVENQRASLTGVVPTDDDLFAAEKVATSVRDVIAVDNELTAAGAVTEEAAAPEPGEATATEIDLQHELSSLLARDPIQFESGSVEVSDTSFPTLDQVAALLAQTPDVRVEIAGHTDADGDETENLTRSTQRAEAVLAYLVGQGVTADRLSAAGYGESRPIASNETQEGKERNRRIEMRILTGAAASAAADATTPADTSTTAPPVTSSEPTTTVAN